MNRKDTQSIMTAPPHLTPSPENGATDAANADSKKLYQRAKKRIAALGVVEPPPRSVLDIPLWVLGGG